MLRLPSSMAAVFRPATTQEVRSWSYGAVTLPRDSHATSWQAQRSTLDDQAIFGPVRDFHCACGKYQGERYRAMICDLCGVKVTERESRRQRFGHINLPVAVLHPLGECGEHLSAVPILPAAFWQAPAGCLLAERYDELARVTASDSFSVLASKSMDLPEMITERAKQNLTTILASLFALLLPVVILAHDWNLSEVQTLAHGLALENRESSG